MGHGAERGELNLATVRLFSGCVTVEWVLHLSAPGYFFTRPHFCSVLSFGCVCAQPIQAAQKHRSTILHGLRNVFSLLVSPTFVIKTSGRRAPRCDVAV